MVKVQQNKEVLFKRITYILHISQTKLDSFGQRREPIQTDIQNGDIGGPIWYTVSMLWVSQRKVAFNKLHHAI